MPRRTAAIAFQARCMSTTPRFFSDLQTPSGLDQLNDAAHQSKAPKPQEPPSPDLPWYLQVEPPITPRLTPQHLLAAQALPDLPPSPPPVLAPLLRYASADLGLDHLHLLDLRGMDPPPSLGANQIMLVGTARGEKHMNVCADRLCRWLRSEHKLRPTADGLLGRNELKIRLRRRAKKLRLLAGVGAPQGEAEEFDDGTRQGWICVHVVGVKPAEADAELEPKKDIIGFDDTAGTVTLVVHIMTEQKRGEIDLEGLWKSQLEASQSVSSPESDREAVG
jgi:Ribosomal silencing factor during starvation